MPPLTATAVAAQERPGWGSSASPGVLSEHSQKWSTVSSPAWRASQPTLLGEKAHAAPLGREERLHAELP